MPQISLYIDTDTLQKVETRALKMIARGNVPGLMLEDRTS